MSLRSGVGFGVFKARLRWNGVFLTSTLNPSGATFGVGFDPASCFTLYVWLQKNHPRVFTDLRVGSSGVSCLLKVSFFTLLCPPTGNGPSTGSFSV